MDVAQVIELGRESLMIAVMVATPLLGTALAVGLLIGIIPVSYTHLRAHETVGNLVCRLLL